MRSRSSHRPLPTAREVILACFAHAAATVLGMPTLVKAYCLAFAPEGAGPALIRRTVRAAWKELEELERAGVVRRRVRKSYEIKLRDRELCPAVTSSAVFGEVELLSSLSLAREERTPASDEPRAPVALCA